jgi:hypothetical protein
MGLLKLVTFPVSLPVSGLKWTLKTLLSEAERRYYDPAVIRQELAELEHHFTAGRIDEATFDEREEALLERFLEAKDYLQHQEAGEAEDG